MKHIWLTILILSTYGQTFRTYFLWAPICKADGSLHTLNQSSLRLFSKHPESPTASCVFIMSEPLTANCFSVRSEPLTASCLSVRLELPIARCFFILSEPLSVRLWSLTARYVSIHCKAFTARCFPIHRKSLTTRCLSIGTDSLLRHPPPDRCLFIFANHPPPDAKVYPQVTHRQMLRSKCLHSDVSASSFLHRPTFRTWIF
jgi:hypothetical protein